MEEVLEQAELVVAADERRLERVRPAAAPALGDDAQGAPRRDRGDLALEQLLAGRLEGDRRRSRRGGSPRRRARCPGGATDWSRAAVLTRSPATIPWLVAPIVTAASPVSTPARALMPGPTAPDGVDELEGGPDGTLGVVLAGGRRAPDGHDRVADELLDRPAVAPDDLGREVEVAGQGLADLLAVALLGERREADEVGEQDRDEAALGDGRLDGAWLAVEGVAPRTAPIPAPAPASAAAPSAVPQSPQNRLPGGLVAPHDGQPDESGAPQSPQNRLSEGFSVPQLAQTTTRAPTKTPGGCERTTCGPRVMELPQSLSPVSEPGGPWAADGTAFLFNACGLHHRV